MSAPALVYEALDIAPQSFAPPVSYTLHGASEGRAAFMRDDCSAEQMRGLLPYLLGEYELVLVYRIEAGPAVLVLRYDRDGITWAVAP